ncbi:MAG: transposase, partial [Lachnospiraceae bacterium]
MYLDFTVKIPNSHGKIAKEKHGDTTYIKYEYDRTYDPKKQYTYPKRATIGKLVNGDPSMMIPNESFLKFFPEIELPFTQSRSDR